MQEIQNSSVTQNFRQVTSYQGVLPTLSLSKTVVPTLELNPQLQQITTNIAGTAFTQATAASTTLIAADPNNDIFITGMNLALSKDATSDCTSAQIGGFPAESPSTSKNFVAGKFITLTAVNGYYAGQNLAAPIKIARNTAVTLNLVCTNIGNLTGSAQVFYYKVYNANS